MVEVICSYQFPYVTDVIDKMVSIGISGNHKIISIFCGRLVLHGFRNLKKPNGNLAVLFAERANER